MWSSEMAVVLWAGQPDRPPGPASLAKLMTALIALERGGARAAGGRSAAACSRRAARASASKPGETTDRG